MEIANQMAGFLGLKRVKNMSNYLGFPMNLSKKETKIFKFILDIMRTKLAGWRANMLSIASRGIFINYVMATITTYFMQCTELLVSTCKELDKLNRDFLWGSSTIKRKTYNLSWEVATLLKEKGGLSMPTSKEKIRQCLKILSREWEI